MKNIYPFFLRTTIYKKMFLVFRKWVSDFDIVEICEHFFCDFLFLRLTSAVTRRCVRSWRRNSRGSSCDRFQKLAGTGVHCSWVTSMRCIILASVSSRRSSRNRKLLSGRSWTRDCASGVCAKNVPIAIFATMTSLQILNDLSKPTSTIDICTKSWTLLNHKARANEPKGSPQWLQLNQFAGKTYPAWPQPYPFVVIMILYHIILVTPW